MAETWSGRKDSNLRPPGPKPGALPGCATPRNNRVIVGLIEKNNYLVGYLKFIRYFVFNWGA